MRIPKLLDEFVRNSQHAKIVGELATAIEQIFEGAEMPLFPSYTNHAKDHIEQTLKFCEMLIPNELWSRSVLTENDAVVLVCATMLHDLALFMNEDCAQKLISGEFTGGQILWSSNGSLGSVADRPWHIEWATFASQMLRQNDKQRQRLLGNNAVVSIDEVHLPKENWQRSTRLIVGEFIRRHHPRLAHEIALFGMPGCPSFPVLSNHSTLIADLIGSVARSHGYSIRNSADYIARQHPGVLRPSGTNAVYLMAVLRIADFLHIGRNRAPLLLLELKNPESEASVQEWCNNRAIEYVELVHTDPQAIYVHITSSHSLHTHLSVKRLLKSLQNELDASCGVIAETYGRVSDRGLKFIRLTKNRVRSNISDPCLLEKLDYVSEHTAFEIDPKIVSLLVKPLYGDSIEMGIRELIQNSVDAVLLRRFFLAESNKMDSQLDLHSINCDIELSFDFSSTGSTLTITDNGIGMTEEIVRKYFLCAGAVFRDSDTWEELSYSGKGTKNTLVRSGRFGIGVFSSFLLAHRMKISTRHVSNTDGRGLVFELERDSELIELRKAKMPHGTYIELFLSHEAANRLRSSNALDWYTLKFPRIQYRGFQGTQIGQYAEDLPLNFSDPVDCNPSAEWTRIKTEDFHSAFWSYKDYPALTCNGLRIAGVNRSAEFDQAEIEWDSSKFLGLPAPNVAIFDNNDHLPLTMLRDHVTGNTQSLQNALVDSLWNAFFRHQIAVAPDRPIWSEHGVFNYINSFHEFLQLKPTFERCNWFCTNEGSGIISNEVLSNVKYNRILICGNIGGRRNSWFFNGIVPDGTLCIPVSLYPVNASHESSYFKGTSDELPKSLEFLIGLGNEGVITPWRRGRGAFTLFTFPTGKLNLQWFKDLSFLIEGPRLLERAGSLDIFSIRIGNYVPDLSYFSSAMAQIRKRINETDNTIFWPFLMDILPGSIVGSRNSITSPIGARWFNLFQGSLIPFDAAERRIVLALALERLSAGT